MKTKSALLTVLFLVYCSAGMAQSDDSQQLRRYNPQTQSIEQSFGQEKVYINFDRTIPSSTRQVLINYISQHYTSSLMSFELDRLPGTDNLYAATGRFTWAGNNSTEATLLLFREQGGTLSEVNKLIDSNADAQGYGLIRSLFFYGNGRMLVIVSMSSVDGDALMDLAYEYKGNNFKPLGQIEVIEKLGESGGVWRIDSPVIRATAEYRKGTYFVTLRGKGSLHLGEKRIASPGTPATFFYDGTAWQQAFAKTKKRS